MLWSLALFVKSHCPRAWGGGRVGFDTFLATRPAERDRDDAHYTLQPVH